MRAGILLLTMLAVSACGDGRQPGGEGDFAVLAQAADGFERARPGRDLVFPRDHGAHPDYRIEWWYLTANLQDESGRNYGAQWTLFRTAVDPPGAKDRHNPWQSEQVYMAHFGLTWPEGHRGFQRYARGGDHGGVARAAVRVEPFAAWLDDWELRSTGSAWLPLEVRAAAGPFALRLELESDRPLVLQGDRGFSQKHAGGGGSHYYSQPFLEARGELRIDGRPVAVTGQAWLDREWSSQFLQPDQAGWDWFALHLESGEKLMLFRLRSRTGHPGENYLHGVLIGPGGDKRELAPGEIALEPVRFERIAGRRLPMAWRIELPEIGRALAVEALRPDQWMDVDFPYWEGAVTVRGDGPGSRGVGFLEMTGYPVTD